MHNTIQDLKGNIRVFCRIRPLLDESKNNETKVYEFNNRDIEKQQITIITPKTRRQRKSSDQPNEFQKHSFEFDRVFDSTASQENVFEEISHFVQSSLDGYKVCIFAYGQTGSGLCIY